MRITNSIITNNTKANINLNKVNEDRLNTMVASGQKITRPSDDPVIAIRALRLNSSMNTLDQYYGKNIPDASAWFKTTETALTQTDEVITKIREQLTTGASDDNTAEDRTNILQELSSLRDQIYSSGNADYAGRTVFTGYRTGEMLTYTEPAKGENKEQFNIVEPISKNKPEMFTYISGTQSVNKDTLSSYVETDVTSNDLYRIRLAYDNLDEGTEVTLSKWEPDAKPATDCPGTTEGTAATVVSITGKTQAEIDAIYKGTKPIVIKETGELLISKADYEKYTSLDSKYSLYASYQKSEWEKGDLRPEHYFMCEGPAKDGSGTRVEYNYNRVNAKDEPVKTGGTVGGYQNQKLNYEVAFNQTIEINTNAGEVFTHDIGRDVDELIRATKAVVDADEKVKKVKEMISKNTDESNKETLQHMLDAATKERDLLKDKMQKMFSAGLTSFGNYQQELSDKISYVGSMRKRLEITENRVAEQRQNFKELSDQNINIDLTESAIDLSSAKLALEAAQLAAGKISQQSLLNYI